MNILVLNSGSSSLKYQMIDPDAGKVLASGSVERIGMADAVLTHRAEGREPVKVSGEILDHGIAIEYVLAVLLSRNHGVIADRREIDAVGHRVVHGGELFTRSVRITDEVIRGIRDCLELAPLHNPHNLRGIEACRDHLPEAPQVAVFDTAFHGTLPPEAFLYGLPYVLYTRHKIRRYGFHGTSHRYVSERAIQLLGRGAEGTRIVTCHLGNGCSAAAILDGRSVDTSMGFTPLEGLLMGTRTGDLDPSVVLYLMGKEELSMAEVSSLMNKHSGLIGLSGVSSDMRELETAIASGNARAELALDVFTSRLRKYIGAYAATLGGLDAVVFTGGIGENSALVRQKTLNGLQFLGLTLDSDRNATGTREREITTADSRARAFVIPTDEEGVIARDTRAIISGTPT